MYFEGLGDVANSPFIVPVAACLMVPAIVLASAWGNVRKREVQSQERLAAIAKGLPLPPTPEELALMHGKPTTDAKRRFANIRLAGIILTAGSVGLALFFALMATILRQREVFAGVACALVPMGLGVGFLIDARLQRRELDEQQFSASTEIQRGSFGQ